MTNTERNRLYALRAMIEQMADSYEDTSIYEMPELFPKWQEGEEYRQGAKVSYNGIVYKVLQQHTSQSNWKPNEATSLYAKALIPDPSVIPDWEQPDSGNAYMTGDKVRFDGKVYESLIDNNVWSPAAYPQGWREVT